MDIQRKTLVEDTEHYLRLTESYLKELEFKVKHARGEEKQKFQALLQDYRIKYSQILTDITIFKARYGIFTSTKQLK